jgi:hypothetical protein
MPIDERTRPRDERCGDAGARKGEAQVAVVAGIPEQGVWLHRPPEGEQRPAAGPDDDLAGPAVKLRTPWYV